MTIRSSLDSAKEKWDDAERRIKESIAKGERPRLSDQLDLGTRWDKIEGWFKDAYKDLPG